MAILAFQISGGIFCRANATPINISESGRQKMIPPIPPHKVQATNDHKAYLILPRFFATKKGIRPVIDPESNPPPIAITKFVSGIIF